MSGQAVAIPVAAACSALIAAFGPAAIGRLREPTVGAEPANADQPARREALADTATVDDEGDRTAAPRRQSAVDPVAPSRPSYAELSVRSGLAAKLAVVAACAGALAGWRLGWTPDLVPWVYLCAAGTVLGYVDAQTRLLPTQLIAPSYGVVVVLVVIAALADGQPHLLLRVLLCWLAMGGFYFLMWYVYPKGLGYGDVRLSGVIGIGLGLLGWPQLLTGLYAGFLLGAVGGGALALMRVVDRKRYPFGPFMLAGAMVGLLWGQAVANWYTSW